MPVTNLVNNGNGHLMSVTIEFPLVKDVVNALYQCIDNGNRLLLPITNEFTPGYMEALLYFGHCAAALRPCAGRRRCAPVDPACGPRCSSSTTSAPPLTRA
jgi:hypothetical protein